MPSPAPTTRSYAHRAAGSNGSQLPLLHAARPRYVRSKLEIDPDARTPYNSDRYMINTHNARHAPDPSRAHTRTPDAIAVAYAQHSPP